MIYYLIDIISVLTEGEQPLMSTNWLHTKKLLEKEFLCEALRGRITYNLAMVRPCEEFGKFTISVDKEEIFHAADGEYWNHFYEERSQILDAGTQLIYAQFVDFLQKKMEDEVVRQIRSTLNRAARCAAVDVMDLVGVYQEIVSVKYVMNAIHVYLSSEIKQSLSSNNPMVLALAYFDRRVGKRTLEKLSAYELGKLPDWTAAMIRLRLDAEGVSAKT